MPVIPKGMLWNPVSVLPNLDKKLRTSPGSAYIEIQKCVDLQVKEGGGGATHLTKYVHQYG